MIHTPRAIEAWETIIAVNRLAQPELTFIDTRRTALCRGFLARRKLQKESCAARIIQTRVTKHLAPKHAAATAIQEIAKEKLTRIHNRKAKEAATVIQTTRRAQLGRRWKDQATFQRDFQAAAVIEAVGRGYITRNHFKKAAKAATCIESLGRGHLLRRRWQKAHDLRNSRAATRINRAAIKYLWRNLYKKLALSCNSPFKKAVYREALTSGKLTVPQIDVVRELLISGLPFHALFLSSLGSATFLTATTAAKGQLTEKSVESFFKEQETYTREDILSVSHFIKNEAESYQGDVIPADFKAIHTYKESIFDIADHILAKTVLALVLYECDTAKLQLYDKTRGGHKRPKYPLTTGWKSLVAEEMQNYSLQVLEDSKQTTQNRKPLKEFQCIDMDRFLLYHQMVEPSSQMSKVTVVRSQIFADNLQPEGKFSPVCKEIAEVMIQMASKKATHPVKAFQKSWKAMYGCKTSVHSLKKKIDSILSGGVLYHNKIVHAVLANTYDELQRKEQETPLICRTLDEARHAGFISNWTEIDPIADAIMNLTSEDIEKLTPLLRQKSVKKVQEFLIEKVANPPPTKQKGLFEKNREKDEGTRIYKAAHATIAASIFPMRDSMNNMNDIVQVFRTTVNLLLQQSKVIESIIKGATT